MDFSRVDSLNLTERLDAEFYKPNFLQNEEKLKSLGNTVLLDEALAGLQLGYTGPTEIYYDPEGMYFLSSKNIINGNLEITKSTDKISIEAHNGKLSKTVVKSGDVLISRTGTVGKCALIGGTQKEFNIAAHLIALRINSKFDPAYISSFFNCHFGKEQSKRLQRGTIIQGLSIFDVPLMRVPNFDRLAQTYIGNQVRQAEYLKEWSRSIELKANELFSLSADVLGYKPKKSERTGWATLENRLDPIFYDKQYSFFNDDWFIKNSTPLTKYITEGSYGVLPASNSYGTGNCRFITAADIVEANYNSQVFINVPIEEVHKKAKISKDQILLEIKGGINYCVVASDILDGTYINGSVFRFSVSGIDENYLAFYLNSKFKNLYCERVSVNNIIKYLDQESIHALPVLRLNDDVESFLGNSYKKNQLLKREIFNLTQASKFLVEALIEGQITEAQLIEAQEALVDGDNIKDRAILSKLTDKGYLAEDGKPLFTDLDKLYELLNEAQAVVDANVESV